MDIEKATFLPIIKAMEQGTDKSLSAEPVFKCIRFNSRGTLEVNNRYSATVKMLAEVDIDCFVNCSNLVKIISKMNTGNINLTKKENNIIIKQERRKVKLPVFGGNTFDTQIMSEMPDVLESVAKIEQSDEFEFAEWGKIEEFDSIFEVFKLALKHCQKDSGYSISNSFYFDKENIVVSDTITCFIAKSQEAQSFSNSVIPYSTIVTILSLNLSHYVFNPKSQYLLCKNVDTLFLSRTLNVNYPTELLSMSDFLSQSHIIVPSHFQQSIETSLLLETMDNPSIILLESEADVLRMKLVSAQGQIEDSFFLEKEVPSFVCEVNARSLCKCSKGLNNLSVGEGVIGFSNESKSVRTFTSYQEIENAEKAN